MNSTKVIHVKSDFEEVKSKTIDDRHRLVLTAIKGFEEVKRVKIYVNSEGEVLIKPMVEIPASEMWLYKNKKSLASVHRGLEQAAKGKVKKLDLKTLD